jgi:hypothetical protein
VGVGEVGEGGRSTVISGVVLIVVTLLSLFFMWGFATIRRIAAALDMLDGEVGALIYH